MHSRNFTLRNVRHLLKRAKELELSDGAVQRLKWFAFALEHDGNASLACRHFGIARTTYVRWAERFDPRDPSSLEEESRRPLRMREPETPPHVVALIRDLRVKHVLMGKEEISETLEREYGVRVSASTVGRTIARHGFFFAATPAHERKRAASNIDIPLPSSEQPGGASSFPLLPTDPIAS
jgi:transposase